MSSGDSFCIKRCKILEGSSEETADEREVLLVDEGSTKLVKLGDLLSYTCSFGNPILQQPNLALKCGLSAICPAGSMDGKWSKNSIEALERLVAENEIYVEPNTEASLQPSVSGDVFEGGVVFKELYHIDPTCPKAAIVRNGTDFVPVSFFLKLNGFAIPNKPLKTRLSSSFEQATAVNKNKGSISESIGTDRLEKRESQSSASSVLSPTSSVKSAAKSSCGSPSGISNVSALSGAAEKRSTASEKRAGSEDSESDDNTTPTVLFMPKIKPRIKAQTSKNTQTSGKCAESNAVDILQLNSSLLERLEINSERLKPKIEPDSSKSSDAKTSAMKMIKFEVDSNISPEPVSEVDKLTKISMWRSAPTDFANDFFNRSNVFFDISDHGIPEFVFYDEVGDKNLIISITPDTVYKPCIAPEKCVFPFQFEQFDSDGVSLRGRCKDVNPVLANRIDTEVDKFLRGKYKGGGYDESDLYPRMAACGFFRQDGHWYRVEFLGHDADMFLVSRIKKFPYTKVNFCVVLP